MPESPESSAAPELPDSPESPRDPAPGAPARPAAAAAPSEPVTLDLTSNDNPATVAPKVESALKEFATRAGESVAEVRRQADLGKSRELGEQGSDKDPTYAPRDRAQDSARQIITLWLIGLFCVLITLSFAALFMVGLKSGFDDEFFKKLKSLLDLLLGPVITLLSSAIGFYFGYQQGVGTSGRDAAKQGAVRKPGGDR